MEIKVNSVKDIFIHIGIIVGVLAILILSFFYIYLPSFTNHKETITVPNLEGITYEKIDEFLTKRNLRYEITSDSSFSGNYPPLAIIKQYPKPGAKVKVNRKIYISLNAKNPPMVKMPKLIDGSVKNAQLVLQSYGLLLGDISYVPDFSKMAVLQQTFDGKEIEPGTYIPKGSKIGLTVGDGYGNQEFITPGIIGKDLEEAEFLIKGSGLNVGIIMKEVTNETPPGTIFKQNPEPGQKIRIGETIDIWVADVNDDYQGSDSILENNN
jgi:eukaryotic-like serine/threonine-protein kinase